MGDAAYYNYPYTEFSSTEPPPLGYVRRGGYGPPFGSPQPPPDDKNKGDTNDNKKKSTIILVVVIVIASVIILVLVALTIYFAVRTTTKPVVAPTLSGVGGSCVSDRDCSAKLICSLGGCVVAPNGSCTADDQCPNNYNCQSGTCEGSLFATCVSSANCSQPYTCQSNLCETGVCNNMCSTQTCTISADCDDPTTQYCYDGNCLMKLQQPCSTDLQCEFYGDFANCVASKCAGLGGTACSHNADCESGSCIDSVCICNNNNQCPAAHPTCSSGVCG